MKEYMFNENLPGTIIELEVSKEQYEKQNIIRRFY